MKKEFYFKRVKKAISSIEEGMDLRKETKRNLFICLLIALLVPVLGAVIDTEIDFGIILIISVVFFFFTGYFALKLFQISKAIKRFKNLLCEKCGTRLGAVEYTKWEEINRRYEANSDLSKEPIYYSTVKFTCKCPNCGEIKEFTDTLRSVGNGVVPNYMLTRKIPVEEVVNKYLSE